MRLLAAALACAMAASMASTAGAQTAWYEGFEGPQASWRPAGANTQYRIDLHRRVQGEAHTGDGCERIRITAGSGTVVFVSHDVGTARVIDELLPTVWVKSDRSGIQMIARVVLPRSEDPRTGRPMTALLHGSSYTKVGHWQQLRVSDLPQLLTRQVRVLRAETAAPVDGREAYVDRILLNVYGGPGATNVLIDDLDMAGYAATTPPSPERPTEPATTGWQNATTSPTIGNAASLPEAGLQPPGQSTRRGPELVRSVLLADGRETFPRIIQYQGEPLSLLKRLGFNAVWVAEPPTPQLLAEASQSQLWLVAPPPISSQSAAGQSPSAPPPQIGPQFDCVLAWDLSAGTADDVDSLKLWADRVRRADPHRNRPLVCRPGTDLRAWSRHADVLLIDRSPLNTSLELTDYARWLRQRPLLARPGTPIWTTVQTQPTAELRRQWTLLGRGQPLPGAVDTEQIRLLTYTAVASGSRALLFESETPLDRDDPDTLARAAVLELLNLELDVIEPWAAAGGYLAETEDSNKKVVATVLRTDRARLLLPIWSEPGAQYASGQAAGNNVSFVVPGAPESHNAYEITPGGLRPLRRERVTGGVKITLDEFDLTTAVVLAQDPLAISSTAQRVQRIGQRAAQLKRELAVRKLQVLAEAVRRLASDKVPADRPAAMLAAANEQLQRCDVMLAGQDHRAAYLAAQRAMRPLRILQRDYWNAIVPGSVDSPVSGPAAVAFRALPWHQEMVGHINSMGLGPNGLVGGDFENLQAILGAGWRHMQNPTDAIQAEAELVPAAAHTGRLGLRLAATAVDPDHAPELVENPPVWIATHPIAVQTGDLICIHGWVCVPEAITGSVDQLMIEDTLTGETLARRIGQTRDWKQFTLYRVVPEAGSMSVRFVMTGLGEAWLDDVTVQRVQPIQTLGITRLPQAIAGPQWR